MASEVTGAKVTLQIMDSWIVEAKLAAMVSVGAMSHKTKELCAQMISLTDHSLKDLADMGHPYATRDPHNPHDPPEQVHTHSGDLLRGLKEIAPKGTSRGAEAEVLNVDEKDVWVQLGTETKIARPYMDAVRRIHADEIQEAGRRAFTERMGRVKSA